jgi:hypothetical protein
MSPLTITHPAYAPHPSVSYAQNIIRNLGYRTGRSMEQWIELIRTAGMQDEKSCRAWLQQSYGLGSATAWMIAERAWNKGLDGTDEAHYLAAAPAYVESMYRGKEGLWSTHQALIDLIRTLGEEIRICPCETFVPVYRHHVIAQINPSSETRLDFGLALRGATGSLPPRLIETGGLQKGDRITHRFELIIRKEVDATVAYWLQVAFELDKRKG